MDMNRRLYIQKTEAVSLTHKQQQIDIYRIYKRVFSPSQAKMFIEAPPQWLTDQMIDVTSHLFIWLFGVGLMHSCDGKIIGITKRKPVGKEMKLPNLWRDLLRLKTSQTLRWSYSQVASLKSLKDKHMEKVHVLIHLRIENQFLISSKELC